MKQKGKLWIDAEGNQIPASRIDSHEKITEQFGQQIASEALAISSRLESAKSLFIDKCQEVATRIAAVSKKTSNQITFYTFDKGFRIEYRQKEQQVLVFQATKEKPSYKDYRLVVLDFADIPKLYVGEHEVADVRSPKGHTVPDAVDYKDVGIVTGDGEKLRNLIDAPSTEEVSETLLKSKPEEVQKKFDGVVGGQKSSPLFESNEQSPFEKAIKEAAQANQEAELMPNEVPTDLPGPSED